MLTRKIVSVIYITDNKSSEWTPNHCKVSECFRNLPAFASEDNSEVNPIQPTTTGD